MGYLISHSYSTMALSSSFKDEENDAEVSAVCSVISTRVTFLVTRLHVYIVIILCFSVPICHFSPEIHSLRAKTSPKAFGLLHCSCWFLEFFGKLGTWGRHLIDASSVKCFNLASGEPDAGHFSFVQ